LTQTFVKPYQKCCPTPILSCRCNVNHNNSKFVRLCTFVMEKPQPDTNQRHNCQGQACIIITCIRSLVPTSPCIRSKKRAPRSRLVPTSACIRSEKYELLGWYLRVPASARLSVGTYECLHPLGSRLVPTSACIRSEKYEHLGWYLRVPASNRKNTSPSVGTYDCLHPLGSRLVPTSACIHSEKYERFGWYL
jgi:hypothetical protein